MDSTNLYLLYHPSEECILVKEDNVNNETTYYVDENFVQIENSSGNYTFTYVKHEGQLIAQKNPDGSKYYIASDHLGSSTVVTNQDGQAIENTTYEPFGSVVEGGTATRYGYEGKEHDSLVGDTDFHFRKYKSDWGMFTQPDNIIQNIFFPQDLNRYSLERNNPLKYMDPSGHKVTRRTRVQYKYDDQGNIVSKKITHYIEVDGKTVGEVESLRGMSFKAKRNSQGEIIGMQPFYDYDVRMYDTGNLQA